MALEEGNEHTDLIEEAFNVKANLQYKEWKQYWYGGAKKARGARRGAKEAGSGGAKVARGTSKGTWQFGIRLMVTIVIEALMEYSAVLLLGY